MGLVSVQRLTSPVGTPVSRERAVAHLRVDLVDETEEALLDAVLQAAADSVEAWTNRALLHQRWALTLDAFPTGTAGDEAIRLPRPPLASVESITYVDTAGETQTMAAADYVVETGTLPGQIRLAYGASWPDARCQPGAVTVTFLAGYGGASDVPAALTAAILLTLGSLWENREGMITGTIVAANPTVAALLGPYRYVEAV